FHDRRLVLGFLRLLELGAPRRRILRARAGSRKDRKGEQQARKFPREPRHPRFVHAPVIPNAAGDMQAVSSESITWSFQLEPLAIRRSWISIDRPRSALNDFVQVDHFVQDR